MADLKRIFYLLVFICAVIVLMMVGLGTLVFLVIAGGCLYLWSRIKYHLGKTKAQEDAAAHIRVVDVEYQMVDEDKNQKN